MGHPDRALPRLAVALAPSCPSLVAFPAHLQPLREVFTVVSEPLTTESREGVPQVHAASRFTLVSASCEMVPGLSASPARLITP